MSCSLWFLRSDSNITKDPEAITLRDMWIPFHNWKDETEETKKNRLTKDWNFSYPEGHWRHHHDNRTRVRNTKN